MRLSKGYIQVYTGDGKGKTTAALGQALRAMGHDLTVYVVQFMKGDIKYGELEMAHRLAPQLTVRQMGRPTFVNKANPDARDIEMALDALELSRECVAERIADILILDEINTAMDFKLIQVEDVLGMLDKKPDDMEIILTGRGAPKEIIERADLVTEMREIKHYYKNGVAARMGIEE